MKVILGLLYQCAEDDKAATLQEVLEGMRESLRVETAPENHGRAHFPHMFVVHNLQ